MRLEPGIGIFITTSNTSFNSIKVRLELNDDYDDYDKNMFQFHKGAIRTGLGVVGKGMRKMFQFHKGAIRTFI